MHLNCGDNSKQSQNYFISTKKSAIFCFCIHFLPILASWSSIIAIQASLFRLLKLQLLSPLQPVKGCQFPYYHWAFHSCSHLKSPIVCMFANLVGSRSPPVKIALR